MMDTAILVEGLSKKYSIGNARNDSLRDSITKLFSGQRAKKEEFWALSDLNLEVKKGDALGIIGKNGAGKSTLLKVLSKITHPTHGRITINGRVSSLLEVGTGFHPELTGKENIYLNGTILGMSRKEVRSKYQQIVDFAGIQKFIHTPVKHYSSGMYVRLAFSVAAHLEPEILIIDEVLAVGDAEFQKRCLGKMEEVALQGRTVLFVSHNLNAIESLCSTCALISGGQMIEHSDDVRGIIEKYLYGKDYNTNSVWLNHSNEFANQYHTLEEFGIYDKTGTVVSGAVPKSEALSIRIKGEIIEENDLLNIGFGLYDEHNYLIFFTYLKDLPQAQWVKLTKGSFSISAIVPPNLLNEGKYRIELVSGLHFKRWLIKPNGGGPSVFCEIRGGLSESPYWIHRRDGLLAPVIEWKSIK